MPLAKKIALVLLIAIVVIILIKDVLIGVAINSIGSSVIGAPVHVGSFHWGVVKQQIRIHNLRIDNPSGFPKQALLEASDIGIDYHLSTLLKGQLYFPFINVSIKEITIIRNKDGKLNVDALKVAQRKEPPKEPNESPKTTAKKNGDISLTIDLMKLNLERTVFVDYARGGDKPVTKVFDLGLKDKTFKNIKSVQQLVSLIIIQGMGPTALKSAAIYTAANFLGTALFPASAIGGAIYLIDQKITNHK